MNGRATIGTISAIWRYPVKSLKGEPLDDVLVTGDGLEGDRTSALIVAAGHVRLGKPYRGKEHALLHTLGNADDARAVAQREGVDLERQDGGRHFDLLPVSIIVDRWLAEVERAVPRTLEPLRFRPNFFVTADEHFAGSEHDLVGMRLAAGDVRLRVAEPIGRCVTVTYDMISGESDRRVGAAVAKERDNIVGIYCEVEVPGTARVGDALLIDA